LRVAIISDIHDNIPKLRTALAGMKDIDEVICLGDLCSPFIVKELSLGFSGPIRVVFGNNDGDRYRITEATVKYSNVSIHGEYVELEIDGKTFSVNHFDNIGRAIVEGQAHDVVCFGHSHQFGVEKVGRSLVVNPGEIFGLLTGRATYVIYDTKTGDAQRVDLD
jgi:hypothetical protein